MDSLNPIGDIQCDPLRGEICFAVSGLWHLDKMESFLRGLTKAAIPIVEARKPIRVLGDMSGFVAQTRDTGTAMRDHLLNARKFGLKRVAIMGASALAKLQYKRLSDGIEVEYFDNKDDALRWLRS